MKLRANCKINIGLDILRRRPDGFHDLETVMVPVRGLFDEVHVERLPAGTPAEEGVLFGQRGIAVDCSAADNTCIKAYRAVRERYNIDPVRILLDKRVPYEAGMGSASSDAAAVIVALNELFALGMDEDEMVATAARTGSDVPFFIRNTPQLCSGRGEIMSPVELPLAGKWLVILKPSEGVPTREAYAGVRPAVPAVPLAGRLAQPLDRWQGSVKNDFEEGIFAARPAIGALKGQLLAAGALYASMSGSGSAVFGIFADEPAHIAAPQADTFIHIEQL